VAKARPVKGISCKASVASNARKIIETRLDELLSWGQYVDDPRYVEELHNLRIAAKRLRYTLELFRFAFPSALADMIDEVKEVQEHIGDMHDADVMIERVLETINSDSLQRSARLLEIATAVDRGTTAQRHQRIRSAMTNRATPRDEIAFYTLVAHRADDREASYRRFVATWKQMEATDFPTRLRRMVGIIPDEPAPASSQNADEDETVDAEAVTSVTDAPVSEP
jgi:hypothetical protein